MAKLFLPPLSLLALGTLLATFHAACPRGPGVLLADYGSLPGLVQQLDHEEKLGSALDVTTEECRQRGEARLEITRQLLDDKITFLEVAAQYRALNQCEPDQGKNVQRFYPGATPDERICRHVIALAQSLDPSPRHAEMVRNRLERELREMIDCQGAVIVP